MVVEAVRGYWQIAQGLTDGPRQQVSATASGMVRAVGGATQDEIASLREEVAALRDRVLRLEAAAAATPPPRPRRKKDA